MLFNLGACGPCSLLPLNLSSSLLLSLQFLSNMITLLYYCLIELGYYSDSISLQYIVVFIPHLNSFTNGLPLYLLSLAALLKSWTNSFIVLLSYSNLLNFATFTSSLSPSPNSFLISAKNSPAISYSNNPASKSSSVFFF